MNSRIIAFTIAVVFSAITISNIVTAMRIPSPWDTYVLAALSLASFFGICRLFKVA